MICADRFRPCCRADDGADSPRRSDRDDSEPGEDAHEVNEEARANRRGGGYAAPSAPVAPMAAICQTFPECISRGSRRTRFARRLGTEAIRTRRGASLAMPDQDEIVAITSAPEARTRAQSSLVLERWSDALPLVRELSSRKAYDDQRQRATVRRV